ncbi:hypothetical protein ZIOFF_061887 [Zingiber officinale]|uniref:Uncharacterized protein n=1 Tax=Zingiber officinale TaxID=94328 RepID=A0A8J5EZP4_ZINOF|nr:hypothetical protein ZIOFF_061887 [Zingiber officinale]
MAVYRNADDCHGLTVDPLPRLSHKVAVPNSVRKVDDYARPSAPSACPRLRVSHFFSGLVRLEIEKYGGFHTSKDSRHNLSILHFPFHIFLLTVRDNDGSVQSSSGVVFRLKVENVAEVMKPCRIPFLVSSKPLHSTIPFSHQNLLHTVVALLSSKILMLFNRSTMGFSISDVHLHCLIRGRTCPIDIIQQGVHMIVMGSHISIIYQDEFANLMLRRDKYNEQMTKMLRYDDVAYTVYPELFTYACPKFITSSTSVFEESLINYNQDAYILQVEMFLYEVKQQQSLSGLRSFLKLYSAISIAQPAAYMEVDESSMRTILMAYKHKMHSIASDGKIIPNADIDFYISEGIIHVVESKPTKSYGDTFCIRS